MYQNTQVVKNISPASAPISLTSDLEGVSVFTSQFILEPDFFDQFDFENPADIVEFEKILEERRLDALCKLHGHTLLGMLGSDDKVDIVPAGVVLTDLDDGGLLVTFSIAPAHKFH